MRVNLFTIGDCSNVNTWSGLPHYFYRSLQGRAVEVTPLSLTLPAGTLRAVRRTMTAQAEAIRLVRPDYTYELFRSRLYHALVSRQARSMARQHRDADLNVFLTFTYSSRQVVDVPVVHYCDRTYEHHLQEIGRRPTRNDRAFINIDRRNIESADLVLTTGQHCLDFIKRNYKPRRAYCLRGGISTDGDVPDPDRAIADKADSTDILFIGRGAHKRGVDVLIESFRLFNQRRQGSYTLHIVGIQRDELPEPLRMPDRNIRFYGYLNRRVPADLSVYNGLMRSAKMFVMPMRPGPFPGVIREALLHCTPAIVSDVIGNPEILMHDRESLLVNSLEPAAFADAMDRLVDDSKLWSRLARTGHLLLRRSTWSHTIDTFLDIVNDCGLLKNRSRVSSGPDALACDPRS
jgi:glycosyltransferase involved in cell wall biosynthesis